MLRDYNWNKVQLQFGLIDLDNIVKIYAKYTYNNTFDNSWMRLRAVSPNYGNKWLVLYNFGVSVIFINNDSSGYEGDGWTCANVFIISLKFKICNPNEDIFNFYYYFGRQSVYSTYMFQGAHSINNDDRRAMCIAFAIK